MKLFKKRNAKRKTNFENKLKQRHYNMLSIMRVMRAVFPQARFSFKQPKVLKRRIFHDIISVFNERKVPLEKIKINGKPFSKTQLRGFMRYYTGCPFYRWNCKPGSKRINLNGEVAGFVSREDSKDALQRLKTQYTNFYNNMMANKAVRNSSNDEQKQDINFNREDVTF